MIFCISKSFSIFRSASTRFLKNWFLINNNKVLVSFCLEFNFDYLKIQKSVGAYFKELAFISSFKSPICYLRGEGF